MSLLQSLDQDRGNFAYSVVNEIKGDQQKPNLEKKYRSYVRTASTMILTNGLGNTLAFYQSKIKPKKEISEIKDLEGIIEEKGKSEELAYAYLYLHIAKWLSGEESEFLNITEGKEPLKWVLEVDSLRVLRATQETLSLLNWMRRLADAMLEEGEVSEE